MTREAAYALLTSAGQPFELIEVEMFGRRCARLQACAAQPY
jgi:hypothetical protein